MTDANSLQHDLDSGTVTVAQIEPQVRDLIQQNDPTAHVFLAGAILGKDWEQWGYSSAESCLKSLKVPVSILRAAAMAMVVFAPPPGCEG